MENFVIRDVTGRDKEPLGHFSAKILFEEDSQGEHCTVTHRIYTFTLACNETLLLDFCDDIWLYAVIDYVEQLLCVLLCVVSTTGLYLSSHPRLATPPPQEQVLLLSLVCLTYLNRYRYSEICFVIIFSLHIC